MTEEFTHFLGLDFVYKKGIFYNLKVYYIFNISLDYIFIFLYYLQNIYNWVNIEMFTRTPFLTRMGNMQCCERRWIMPEEMAEINGPGKICALCSGCAICGLCGPSQAATLALVGIDGILSLF